MVPSRQALDQAEDYYRRTGDELEGFLSEETGFMPRIVPELTLPESHRAWDEIAAGLPTLWRDVRVRAAIEDLPALRAREEELPTRYVRRASTILGMVAHSYVHSERDPHGELPAVLMQPWDDLGRRLGKTEPFLRYEDVTLGNWRKSDPAGGLTQENLRMLVPAVGIPTERRFYLTQVETNARATPLVGAVVRVQEAAARGDDDAIEAELLVIIETLRALLDEALIKLDPNPYSPTTVDPVLFGGIVADLAVPLQQHIPGPSGTAAPVFHVLDSFLGRKDYRSDIGVDAIRLREWGPKALGRFVAAISEGPGAHEILKSRSTRVLGLMQTLLDLYSGPRGWLEVHRVKAYGFIEMSFKAGRPVTIGGFGGTFHKRPWRTVHSALDEARGERPHLEQVYSQRAVLADRGSNGSAEVVLDVHGEGVVYRPGDRCQIVPVNPAALVQRTLRALGAGGDEAIALTPAWRLALRQRSEDDEREELPLAEFLAYAKLRPLPRALAKDLVGISGSPSLDEIVAARREDELELWEAIELMAADGFEVSGLVGPTLAATVPSETYRVYAIASSASEQAAAEEIALTVEKVEYGDGDPRRGAGSAYLRDEAELGSSMPIAVMRPTRFRAPADDRVPLLMLAAGTGVAPLRAILSARAEAADPGPAWLFVDPPPIGLGDYDWLTVRRGPDVALVAELLRSADARVYVCGTDAYVQQTLGLLRELSSPDQVRALVGKRRLMLQVSPTHAPWRGPGVLGDRTYDISEVVLHNDAEHGYWFVIDGNVYDMTEFRHLHPGGAYIIDAAAGMDASDEYATVLHYKDPEINAMLAMYKIGATRRLRFDGDSGLQDLFRAWVRCLFLIVEMQNAFENDLVYLRSQTTAVESAETVTPLKLMLFSKAQDRFEELYYRGLSSQPLDELWRASIALCDPGADPAWMAQELGRIGEAAADDLAATRAELRRLWEHARAGSADERFLEDAVATVAALASMNQRFFREIKRQVREGVLLFERHERATLERVDELLAVLRATPGSFAAYHRELTDLLATAQGRAG